MEEQVKEELVSVRLSFLVRTLLLGFRDKVTLSEKDGDDFKKLIGDIKAKATESLCHIQERDGLVVVWNPQDWAIDIQRHELSKASSEKRVDTYNKAQDIKDELMKIICIRMGKIGIEKALAENIINKKITAMVLQLGGSEDLCRRIQEL
jgi:hypothetical protein